MKKVLSIVLAIAMIATMSVAAFAATGSALEESASKAGEIAFDVNGVYANNGTVNMYKVDISWDDATFTFGAKEKWNTLTHEWYYVENAWSGEGEITVKNHSSEAVAITCEYAAADNNGTDMAFEGEGTVATAVGTTPANAPSITIKATMKAQGEISNTTAAKIGTITVKVA